jgi:hypothetical protein
MVMNMVLSNLLVSLVYELFKKYFLCDETQDVYFIAHLVGTMHIFTVTTSYYINIDRGRVM